MQVIFVGNDGIVYAEATMSVLPSNNSYVSIHMYTEAPRDGVKPPILGSIFKFRVISITFDAFNNSKLEPWMQEWEKGRDGYATITVFPADEHADKWVAHRREIERGEQL